MIVEGAHLFAEVFFRILDVDELSTRQGGQIFQVAPVSVWPKTEGEDGCVRRPIANHIFNGLQIKRKFFSDHMDHRT